MPAPILNLDILRDRFAHDNLERLSGFEPPPPVDDNADAQSRCSVTLKVLTEWSKKNKSSIDAAMKDQVFGAKNDIQWTNAFLPFMESAAVYLRDWGLLHQAWREIRLYKEERANDKDRYKKIVNLHNKAYEQIDQLAHEWDMHYVHICDLVSEHPEGKPLWDGPFCGAFLPNDMSTTAPFIGLAFKGTNPFQLREVEVDLNYQLIEASDALGSQQVSEGVYTGLFGKFQSLDSSAFDHTREKLGELVVLFHDAPAQPRVHVTGHSLGGSYSQLCYAGLLTAVDMAFPEHATMGDQYTFGAPRVGSQDWARYNAKLVAQAEGRTWRIVNNRDIVPQVPPTTLKRTEVNFRHVVQGVQIFNNKVPEKIPDETEGPNPPPYSIKNFKEFIKAVIDGKDHCNYTSSNFACAIMRLVANSSTVPNYYYDALVYAIENAKS